MTENQREALRTLIHQTPGVVSLRVAVGEDSVDKAMWVWVALSEVSPKPWTSTKRDQLRKTIRETLWDNGWEHWAYVRFRAEFDPSIETAEEIS
jgi:hypothetical protein